MPFTYLEHGTVSWLPSQVIHFSPIFWCCPVPSIPILHGARLPGRLVQKIRNTPLKSSSIIVCVQAAALICYVVALGPASQQQEKGGKSCPANRPHFNRPTCELYVSLAFLAAVILFSPALRLCTHGHTEETRTPKGTFPFVEAEVRLPNPGPLQSFVHPLRSHKSRGSAAQVPLTPQGAWPLLVGWLEGPYAAPKSLRTI